MFHYPSCLGEEVDPHFACKLNELYLENTVTRPWLNKIKVGMNIAHLLEIAKKISNIWGLWF